MPVSYEEAKSLKGKLEFDCQKRHRDFKLLREFWKGNHWDHFDSGSNSIASLFKDLRSSRKDVGPDVRLVHNIIQEVCVKYQTYLTPLPMIRVPADKDSNRGRDQATTRERFLYGCWGENDMTVALNKIAWYLPLFGDCFLGIHPDMERNMPRVIVRSPETAYPIPNSEGGLGAVIFCSEVPFSTAKRDYPRLKEPQRKRGFRGKSSEPMVEILEYSDDNEFHRWVDGEEVNGRVHNFGFNLFDQVPFIRVPDESWNHGAVEQAVNLNLAENALRSLLFQAVLENVFPTLILEDPYKFPEIIEKGAGGVIGVNPGGKAYYMTPPVQALPVQQAFLADNERAIKQATSMPDVNFGQFHAAIVTGKAINELQGAGTGSTVEMVQGTGVGSALSKWNSKAIIMAQRMFRDKPIMLEGFYRDAHYDLNPKSFAFNKKGSEVVGSTRNEVVFSPYMNAHEKLVMSLQGVGGGLFSKQYAREQVGVSDSQAMEDAIMGERIQEAVLGAIEQALIAAGATPEAANDAEAQALAYMSGQAAPPSNFAPTPPALGPGMAPGGAAPGQFPVGPLAPGAEGAAFSPALALPPGSAPPEMMNSPAAPQPEGIPLDEVIGAFQGLQNIQGRVFLVGEIVQTGTTADDIEVALTNPADRQAITDGLPQYAGLFAFVTVQDEPAETYIEVTPGAEPFQGGSDVDIQLDDDEEVVA